MVCLPPSSQHNQLVIGDTKVISERRSDPSQVTLRAVSTTTCLEHLDMSCGGVANMHCHVAQPLQHSTVWQPVRTNQNNF